MPWRALIGLLKGVLIGGVIGLLLVKGIGLTAFGAFLAYTLAVLTGALTGIIAGKPIWAKGARIEAGLKAAVGALVAAGGMYALRKWVGVDVNLGDFGQGVVGELPMVSLPLLSTLLAVAFELDNTGEDAQDEAAKPETTKARVAELDEGALLDDLSAEEVEPRRVQKKS